MDDINDLIRRLLVLAFRSARLAGRYIARGNWRVAAAQRALTRALLEKAALRIGGLR